MPWFESAFESPALLASAFVLAASVSALGSAWAIAHAHRNDLFDQPGERRSHDTPTPRGGGVGIVVATLATMLIVIWTGLTSASWWWAAGGLVLVAATGWWDDHRPLPAWPRLLVHAIAAACLAGAVHLQGADGVVVITAFAMTLVLVNAWNFMDGINGLAASQAMLCALGFAMVLGDVPRLLALVLAGACLGFLPFNFPRARIFLGDVGSGALGYLVAMLLAAGFASHPPASWPLLLLPAAAMLADTGLTLIWRMRRGERWWQPHVQHAYQQWSRSFGHARVSLGYATFSGVAAMAMLALMPVGYVGGTGVIVALLLVCLAVWSRSR
ncbi:glycosyltransferase family 4 protein [Thermomonas sp. HDW16]|uniref:MraY family glycosyltransferase n=1 Tax=Thermomonas sp. HDW16 TaxID=2714945 RepID=UPI0014095C4D|nr:glycosyltransferase family 4 protein [Thermomonas sp. HDW16]QIL20593.1 glycosyltransferase family 4 protein [Thermomonas sp. HDW16]